MPCLLIQTEITDILLVVLFSPTPTKKATSIPVVFVGLYWVKWYRRCVYTYILLWLDGDVSFVTMLLQHYSYCFFIIGTALLLTWYNVTHEVWAPVWYIFFYILFKIECIRSQNKVDVTFMQGHSDNGNENEII